MGPTKMQEGPWTRSLQMGKLLPLEEIRTERGALAPKVLESSRIAVPITCGEKEELLEPAMERQGKDEASLQSEHKVGI